MEAVFSLERGEQVDELPIGLVRGHVEARGERRSQHEEVAGLRARSDLHLDLPSMRAVGYRQVWEHLSGETDIGQMQEKALSATRQLAKRQHTWLRSWPHIESIRWGEAAAIALEIGHRARLAKP